MRNLLTRSATGVIFVAVILAAMLLGQASYLVLLVCIVAGCGAEFHRVARTPLQRTLGLVYIAAAVVLMYFLPLIGSGMTDSAPPRTLLGNHTEGWDARIAPAFVIIVWANDIFAFIVGSALGRRKMCETLSPRKTLEGLVGGIVGAVAAAALVGKFWLGGGMWLWLAFGLVVAIAAVGGDLAESAVKRRAGVKDSGNLLPGHGGLLDRFDAMLGAAPVAFLFLLVTYLAG